MMVRAAALVALLALAPSADARRDSGGRGLRLDLLRPLDPQKDCVRGTFLRDGKTLVLMPHSCVQIPYEAPEEYDLTFVLVRTDLQGKFVIGLASGDRQFDAVIDNFHKDEHRTGLHNLDGKHVTDRENDVRVGPVFANDTPTAIACSVRKSRVTVAANGKEILRWSGDFSRLGVDGRFRVPDRRALFFGNAISTYRITRIEFSAVTGRGRPTR